MTSDQRFAILITLLGVGGTAVLAGVGWTIRLAGKILVKWTQSEDRISQVAESLEDLVIDKDKTHQAMLDQMREDRKATNDRLTWLERNLWNQGRRHGP